jgi:Tn3 transposase DDE domain
VHRRDALAAVLAIGCNLGCQRMELASGLSFLEISRVTDWYLTEETLKAAGIDIINFASRIPVSRVYDRGATRSADGMRFYAPIHILGGGLQPCAAGPGRHALCSHLRSLSTDAPRVHSLPLAEGGL